MRRWLTAGALVVLSGCGGSSGTTPASPTSPTGTSTPAPPSTPVTPAGWRGTVTATRRTLSGPLDTTQTFEGAVSFDRGVIEDYSPPDLLLPLIPANATIYVLRPGLLKLTHSGSVGPCSYGTSTWDVLMKKSDGFIAVGATGTMVGRITLPDTSFPITVTCPPVGAANGSTSVQMDLAINGTVVGTSATGTMTPSTYAASTFTGSWNLAAQ